MKKNSKSSVLAGVAEYVKELQVGDLRNYVNSCKPFIIIRMLQW